MRFVDVKVGVEGLWAFKWAWFVGVRHLRVTNLHCVIFA